MIPYGSLELPYLRPWRRAICFALVCAAALTAPARADDLTCDGIKRALVSANLAVMRIERGPLALAPEQAAVAVGQMTALTRLAPMACSLEDAAKINAVVAPRVEALQHFLPAAPSEADETPAGDTPPAGDQTAQDPPPGTTMAGTVPPAPPSRPARTERPRESVSAATCTRIYYMKGNHRRWRCQR